MGHAARANPRSFDGKTSERSVLKARLTRFVLSFQTKAAYEDYLTRARVTPDGRRYLDQLLCEVRPEHASKLIVEATR